jgi:hypothetical protein
VATTEVALLANAPWKFGGSCLAAGQAKGGCQAAAVEARTPRISATPAMVDDCRYDASVALST